MNKINEATCFFLLKSEKKTDEGGPEKQFIFFYLSKIWLFQSENW